MPSLQVEYPGTIAFASEFNQPCIDWSTPPLLLLDIQQPECASIESKRQETRESSILGVSFEMDSPFECEERGEMNITQFIPLEDISQTLSNITPIPDLLNILTSLNAITR